MSAYSLSGLLRSRCITILAGEDSQQLTVHEAVLSKSGLPSLQKLVEPGWKESMEGCIDWTQTNLQTVERVMTWLYFRDYQSADPVPRENEKQSNETHCLPQGSEAREDTQPVVGVVEPGLIIVFAHSACLRPLFQQEHHHTRVVPGC